MKKSISSINKVFLNSGIYTITSIIQKAIGFILLPLYTIYLTPSDYGITGIVNSLTQVLTLLFTLSLNASIQRYYYIYKNDESKRKSFFGTIIIFIVCNSIVMGCMIIGFKDYLLEPFIDKIAFFPYVFIGILTIMVNPVYSIYQTLLQTMQKAKSFAVNSLLYITLLVILNIVLIVFLKLGALGQLLSALITGLIFGIYSIISLYVNGLISFRFNFDYLKEALVYSVPLLPHLMSTSIANLLSRLFLNNSLSTASVGLFNIASQFTIIIDTFQTSINSAYIPWFYNLMGGNYEDKKQIVKFSDIINRINVIICLGMGFFIKEVLQLFIDDSFLISWTIIPLMLVAYQIRQIYYFHVNTLFYNTKATKYIFIASVSGSLINVMFSASMTTYYGLLTPAIALLIQNLIVTIIVVILSRFFEPVDFKLWKMVWYVFYLAIFLLIGLHFNFKNPVGEISIQNVIYKFFLLIIATGLLFHNELSSIITKIKKIRK